MRDAPVKTTGYNQGILVVSVKAKEKVGTLRILEDGRKFRYAMVGENVSAGQNTSCTTTPADHIGGSIVALNNSNTQMEVTIVAGTAIASNALAGGYVHVESGMGAGRSYRIDSNTPVSVAGTTIVLSMTDRIPSYDGTTKITLVPSPWHGVTVGGVAEASAGVAMVDVVAGSFAWLQTGGPALAIIAGTPAVGGSVIAGPAGSFSVQDGAGITIDAGYMYSTVGVDGEFKPVMLTID